MLKKQPFLLITLAFTACATTQPPQSIPTLHTDRLPSVKFKALKPKTIRLVVLNERKINKSAGNAAEVAQVVSDSMVAVFERAGITVKDTSPNQFKVFITDDAQDGEGECVRLTGNLEMS